MKKTQYGTTEWKGKEVNSDGCSVGWRIGVEGVATRVSLYVLDHMIFADETFIAYLAHEGLLASVQTHVAS